MIIFDYSGIALASVFAQKKGQELNEDLMRHIILNSIRMYVKKYSAEFGSSIVIAADNYSWRRKYFPQYKAKRREARTSSEAEKEKWSNIFDILDVVLKELDEFLPYSVLHISGAEADDIIGTLAEYIQKDFGYQEPMLIISQDKDFIQLHRFSNVKQFSPQQNKWIKDSNPRYYLFEHILKGDPSDGIPNILSSDDVFITEGIRQTPLTKKKIEQYMEILLSSDKSLESVLTTNEFRNFSRNQKLIDLTMTPPELKQAIINEYELKLAERANKKGKILKYFSSRKCLNLIEYANDFIPKGIA
jgi:5'-3' exonuclease